MATASYPLLTGARVSLATLWLLAIWLNPFTSPGRIGTTHRTFVLHAMYLIALVVATWLLWWLGDYARRRRWEMSQLGAWPALTTRTATGALRAILSSAAAIVDAPRALLIWEAPGEPWLQVTLWDKNQNDVQQWRESPGVIQPLVNPALKQLHFVTDDAAAVAATALHTSPTAVTDYEGAPVHPILVRNFSVRSALALALRGESGRGRLFLLDRPRLTADDLTIGVLIAQRTAESLDQLALARRVRGSAAAQERARLFRDLHDGVLQSLTGAALKLQTAQRLLKADGIGARQKLHEIQRLLLEEQRSLRLYISEAKREPVGFDGNSVETGLRELLQHIHNVWGLESTLALKNWNGAGDVLGVEVVYLVREALVNAARHGHALHARIGIGLQHDVIEIEIADDGQGFPFRGELSHDDLTARRLGPVMLKQRVDALRGSLSIQSGAQGARLQIRLPLAAVAD
jgi:signal transduction histidine kinase